MVSFTKYRDEMRPAALKEVAYLLDLTPLAQLDDLALRLAHLLENRQIDIPQSTEGAAFPLLLAKAITEVTAFVACYRAGQLWAGYHHLRAMLELYAATVHLVHEPTARDHRFEQFHEYAEAAAYREHLLSVDNGANHLRFASDDPRLEAMKGKAGHWSKLYGRTNLAKLRTWHDRVPIEDLLKQCDQREKNDSHRWRRLYADVCNATHVSPIGHRAVGVPGLPVFAMPKDVPSVRGKVVIVGALLENQMALWEAHFVPDSRLHRRTAAWRKSFLQAVMRTKPEGSPL